MTAKDILDKYISFFESRGHTRIENSSLVPLNDPTTLFTSSGMQPLVPFLLGETHPSGIRLVNAQNCFRAQDIDEIGDNRHTTFFRMLGNWSLGDYFKKEQIPWFFEFLTDGIGLDPNKLYVTVFKGSDAIEKDTESYEIWKGLFESKGISTENRIFEYGVEKNWWSRAGVPDNMPVGEPGGPDSEVFYDFGTEHKVEFGEKCHVNCDCGRYMEIGNSVFMQYIKTESGFENLPKQNVDFGGGLERLLAASENQQDIFKTHLYSQAIEALENLTKNGLNYDQNPKPYRIIADHLNAATFLVSSGAVPSNKGQGYVVRRLIRRAMIQARELGMEGDEWFTNIAPTLEVQNNVDGSLKMDPQEISQIITAEIDQFRKTINQGLKIVEKYTEDQLNALNAFNLFQSHGFPVEITRELFEKRGKSVDMEEYNRVYEAHKKLSQTASASMFKGGLADHSELTVKGHTATHLLHQALRDVLGDSVHQTGSNITSERVRFDFAYDKKVTEEELAKVKEIVLEKIKEDLPVHFEIMPIEKAKSLGAIGLFDDKYAKDVKIYFVGDYSIEFCGGPHVEHTAQINTFDILKEEGVARGVRRVYAKVS